MNPAAMEATFDLLSAPDLAAELSVDIRTLEQWRYRREGPRFVKVGQRVRYRRRDVEAWLDSRTRGSP